MQKTHLPHEVSPLAIDTIHVGDVALMNEAFRHADGRWVPLGPRADVALSGMHPGRLALYRTIYGAPTFVEGAIAPESAAVFVIQPECGDVVINGEALAPGEVLLYGGGAEHVATGGRRHTLALMIPANELQRRLEALLGDRAPDLRARRYRVRLAPDAARQMRDVLEAALASSRSESTRESSAAFNASLEESLIDQVSSLMAMAWPSPPGLVATPATRDAILKHAREFLEEDLQRSIRLSDLCRELGVGAETLRLTFRQFLGLPPMRYLKLLRMHKARTLLRAGASERESVKAVALSCGFWELGRFAVEYRRLFGESPSETLRSRAFPFADLNHCSGGRL